MGEWMFATRIFATGAVGAALVMVGCLYRWPDSGDHSVPTAIAATTFAVLALETVVSMIWGW